MSVLKIHHSTVYRYREPVGLGKHRLIGAQQSTKVVKGSRSNQRWYPFCALKFKELLW